VEVGSALIYSANSARYSWKVATVGMKVDYMVYYSWKSPIMKKLEAITPAINTDNSILFIFNMKIQ